MKEEDFLNAKYQQLCAELGDAHIKLEKIQKYIKDLKSRIEHINQAQPIMAEFRDISQQAPRRPKKPVEASNE